MSGKAIDTILAFNTQAGAGAFPQALAAAPGDSLIVRGTVGESKAHLMAAVFKSDAAGNEFRIVSPLLHDNVTGLTFVAPENPTIFSIPEPTSVELNEQDTITVQGQSGAATTITAGLAVYYDDLRGTDADLYRWGDIKGDIKFIKSVQVQLGAIAVGAWTDTLITATENQLHADASYAVLGYTCTPAVALVGVKGVATGNLRACGPGFAQTLEISDYYIKMAEEHERPYIPVFQANDRTAFFVSAADSVARAGQAVTVSLVVAQLKTKR
jgi:hypothetical protein